MVKKGMFIGERYEIIDKVGSGGMSDVYKAKDHKLGRFVAIKVLKQEFSEDKSFVSKFKIEAQSAAGLAHPNIVNIFDVGEDNGIYYIVMELVEGITLKTYINRKGSLPVKEAVSIAVQVAQGIEAAHNNHIIHRDIKPQNIMISREGKVKVTDFGIARAASTNTINSNAMGSVHYISPEQARNGYVDEKSDIYSLGISIFEMITGTVPFDGDSTVTIALAHVQEDMPSMSQYVENVPISVEKIVEKCTQKKPDRRYLKVSSLIADLKKSLVTPDEDFVQLISSNTSASMVMISEAEVNVIKKDAGIDELLEDIDDETSPIQIKEVDAEDIDIPENEDEEDDEFEGRNQKIDKIVTIGSIVAAVVIVLAAIIIFSKLLGGCSGSRNNVKRPTGGNQVTTGEDQSTEIDSKQTAVPSLVNRRLEDVIELLNEKGLDYKVVKYVKDNTVEAGRIISHEPKAGTVVDKGSRVELVVSEGKEDIAIKDVANMKKEEAEKILKAQGFDVSTEFLESEEIEAGIVMYTDPEADRKLSYGSKVVMYVSKGMDKQLVEVPNLKDLTREEAELLLNEKGLTIKITEVYHDTIPMGVIINQEIIPNTVIDLLVDSNVIVVTVSMGPQETTTPDTRKDVIFTKITALDSTKIPQLSETEMKSAHLKVVLKYTDTDGSLREDNITKDMTGYDSTNRLLKYTEGWTHGAVRAKVHAGEGETITMTITLLYTKDAEETTTPVENTSEGTTDATAQDGTAAAEASMSNGISTVAEGEKVEIEVYRDTAAAH